MGESSKGSVGLAALSVEWNRGELIEHRVTLKPPLGPPSSTSSSHFSCLTLLRTLVLLL